MIVYRQYCKCVASVLGYRGGGYCGHAVHVGVFYWGFHLNTLACSFVVEVAGGQAITAFPHFYYFTVLLFVVSASDFDPCSGFFGF